MPGANSQQLQGRDHQQAPLPVPDEREPGLMGRLRWTYLWYYRSPTLRPGISWYKSDNKHAMLRPGVPDSEKCHQVVPRIVAELGTDEPSSSRSGLVRECSMEDRPSGGET